MTENDIKLVDVDKAKQSMKHRQTRCRVGFNPPVFMDV